MKTCKLLFFYSFLFLFSSVSYSSYYDEDLTPADFKKSRIGVNSVTYKIGNILGKGKYGTVYDLTYKGDNKPSYVLKLFNIPKYLQANLSEYNSGTLENVENMIAEEVNFFKNLSEKNLFAASAYSYNSKKIFYKIILIKTKIDGPTLSVAIESNQIDRKKSLAIMDSTYRILNSGLYIKDLHLKNLMFDSKSKHLWIIDGDLMDKKDIFNHGPSAIVDFYKENLLERTKDSCSRIYGDCKPVLTAMHAGFRKYAEEHHMVLPSNFEKFSGMNFSESQFTEMPMDLVFKKQPQEDPLKDIYESIRIAADFPGGFSIKEWCKKMFDQHGVKFSSIWEQTPMFRYHLTNHELLYSEIFTKDVISARDNIYKDDKCEVIDYGKIAELNNQDFPEWDIFHRNEYTENLKTALSVLEKNKGIVFNSDDDNSEKTKMERMKDLEKKKQDFIRAFIQSL